MTDFTVTIFAGDHPIWRIRGPWEVIAVIEFALLARPKSYKLVAEYDGSVRDPHEVLTDKDEARQRIHALIFEEHLRSVA